MTIVAGLLVRRPELAWPQGAGAALRDAMSRTPGDPVQEHRDDRVLLLKVDVGAFDEPAWHRDDDGSVSLLAGELLLNIGNPATRRPRGSDLAVLHQGWARADATCLTSARGAFCAVHYSPATGAVTLFADKVGIRPLYYWVDHRFLVFASALRILEAVPLVPKVMDLRGVTEALTLGAPLGSRTPYADIRILRPAEIVRCAREGIERRRYWRWDAVPAIDRPEREQLAAVWERFSTAVSCRLGADTAALAFLSGGLDSRCNVAALRSRSVRVRTVTFGEPATQERAFASAFAAAVGTEHYERPMPADRDLSVSVYATDRFEWGGLGIERPRLVWGGDGGSVALGGVGQTQEMLDALRAGNHERAIDSYLRQEGAHPVRRLLTPPLRSVLSEVPASGIAEEFAALHSDDRGRDLLCFLLVHDQRRYLARHFEDIDLHRMELVMPFFDCDLLQTVLEVPPDWYLYHAFYAKWLAFFPPAVTSVPWQTYRGHVPCPLPIPGELADQWAEMEGKTFRRLQRRRLVRRATQLLSAPAFPHELLRRRVLHLATLIHGSGLRDYGYVIQQAEVYHRYWTRSKGRWRAPVPSDDSRPTGQTVPLPVAVAGEA